MRKIELTAFDLAQRFRGTKEMAGQISNPMVLAMLKLDQEWPKDDAVPWCSAFVNFIAWMLRLPRSKSLRARSWLNVGEIVTSKEDVAAGFDVVILKRGAGNQPGPEVIEAPGHVGFFAGWEGANVALLGGNQNDEVNVSYYNIERILGIRRLYS